MLVDLLIDSARRQGRRVAFADPHLTLTYDRLLTLAGVMSRIIASGTNRDKVGLMLPAGAAFAGCLFGGFWASRRVVPLNFLLSGPELARIVKTAGLDLVLSVKPLADVAAKLPARTLFLEDLPIRRGLIGAAFRRTPRIPTVEPDDTAVILFTSGTSGEPKGVELTYHNLVSNCHDCIATADITPDHRLLNCLPPFHVFGLTANVLVPVTLGATVYCLPRFSPTAAARVIAENRISVFMAIPSMYAAISRLKSLPENLMDNVYMFISGGEPLPEPLAAGYRERFGIDLLQGYGLTETSPVCTLETPQARRPGSIGRPIRNVRVRVIDSNGVERPLGEDGELCVKGPNVMKGYYEMPQATRQAITPDGWFRTGDWGRLDADGFVTLTGRLKEMMIVSGENVFPREIEAVLERHEAVEEVAVVGVSDASRGEVPVAFVICREGKSATEAELRQFARSALAGYKVPRHIHVQQEFPRSPTGKVLKRRLLQRYQSKRSV